ncbi:MAG: hypothetical protein D3916_16235 [Candidatus Electrothrix sp. MAN1_4]|nr:hypothetical protein [Candidatus Electrothrix sp. MAN1_4]
MNLQEELSKIMDDNTMTQQDTLTAILNLMCSHITDHIFGGVIVDIRGQVLAESEKYKGNGDIVAASVVGGFGAGQITAKELLHDDLSQITLKTRQGYVFVYSIGQEHTLVVTGDKGAPLGLVDFAIYNPKNSDTIASNIEKVLGISKK